jgi:hypothetical protein
VKDYHQFNVLAEPHHPVDWQILQLITGSFEHRPWALGEVLNQTDADSRTACDGLLRLSDVRLIQRVEDYLIPTRAAVYYTRLSAPSQKPPRSGTTFHLARRWCEPTA